MGKQPSWLQSLTQLALTWLDSKMNTGSITHELPFFPFFFDLSNSAISLRWVRIERNQNASGSRSIV
jgi:hypothetical protein